MSEHVSSRVPMSVATVLTAVPGLLGFVPHRSLVILALTDGGERVVVGFHPRQLPVEFRMPL